MKPAILTNSSFLKTINGEQTDITLEDAYTEFATAVFNLYTQVDNYREVIFTLVSTEAELQHLPANSLKRLYSKGDSSSSKDALPLKAGVAVPFATCKAQVQNQIPMDGVNLRFCGTNLRSYRVSQY